MKHLHPFIVFLLTTSLYAQTSEIIFSHGDIIGTSMAIHGDELYFPTETNIQKIDLTQTNPSAVQVLEVYAENLVFHGDDLYFNAGSTISKIDVTDQSPTIVDVVTSGLNSTNYLAFKGDVLYIVDDRTEDGMEVSGIFKFDVSGSDTTPTHVIDGQDPVITGLAFYGDGNEMFFASHDVFNHYRIFKIDISQTSPTATEVISGLTNIPENIAFDEDDLYISFFNKIVRTDVTADSPTTTDVLSIVGPSKLIIDGEFLYIGSRFTDGDDRNAIGRITKYTDATLALEPTQTNALRIYPNPVQEKLYVLGLTNPQPYTLYNLLGVAIASGTVSDNTPIAVQQLNNGIYFLQFENGKTLKFIKK